MQKSNEVYSISAHTRKGVERGGVNMAWRHANRHFTSNIISFYYHSYDTIVNLYISGTILGTMMWGYLADTRGRRSMLLVALLGAATINMVASISVNWIMLMLIQFVASFL